MTIVRVLGILVALLATTGASAATVTFDDLDPSGSGFWLSIGNVYEADGFRFATNGDFRVYRDTQPQWTGSPGLTAIAVGAQIVLDRIDGGLFALTSIGIARGDGNRNLVPIEFVGARADGSLARTTYTFPDAVPGRLETFALGPAFDAVTSVTWYQGAEWHQFDNVNASPVPLPATAGLLLAGLAATFLTARRNAKT